YNETGALNDPLHLESGFAGPMRAISDAKPSPQPDICSNIPIESVMLTDRFSPVRINRNPASGAAP
ncbi:MAG TPA: hypothetical protein PKH28_11500, partial [Candidatus Competibacteraceae bacterium]|nr:hypothetical protein [Candidatus Competibacteraceae bacterium]